MPTESQQHPLVEVASDRIFTETILTRQQALAAVEIALQAIEAAGFKIVSHAWLAKTAMLLHKMAGEGVELIGEADPADLFMETGPALGFDENYTSDDDLRAMIAASPAFHPEKK